MTSFLTGPLNCNTIFNFSALTVSLQVLEHLKHFCYYTCADSAGLAGNTMHILVYLMKKYK